ncbi:hypothetical protein BdWA1_000973 [Babesia duncani]|uniref:Uncharacterized protein n=1 Tax=Babesia duncani TaxID=323732 RepID=A0AAD9PN58_9APIC|nr:hypothetical protein BdWA1_000973 [Babesia duncani]
MGSKVGCACKGTSSAPFTTQCTTTHVLISIKTIPRVFLVAILMQIIKFRNCDSSGEMNWFACPLNICNEIKCKKLKNLHLLEIGISKQEYEQGVVLERLFALVKAHKCSTCLLKASFQLFSSISQTPTHVNLDKAELLCSSCASRIRTKAKIGCDVVSTHDLEQLESKYKKTCRRKSKHFQAKTRHATLDKYVYPIIQDGHACTSEYESYDSRDDYSDPGSQYSVDFYNAATPGRNHCNVPGMAGVVARMEQGYWPSGNSMPQSRRFSNFTPTSLPRQALTFQDEWAQWNRAPRPGPRDHEKGDNFGDLRHHRDLWDHPDRGDHGDNFNRQDHREPRRVGGVQNYKDESLTRRVGGVQNFKGESVNTPPMRQRLQQPFRGTTIHPTNPFAACIPQQARPRPITDSGAFNFKGMEKALVEHHMPNGISTRTRDTAKNGYATLYRRRV